MDSSHFEKNSQIMTSILTSITFDLLTQARWIIDGERVLIWIHVRGWGRIQGAGSSAFDLSSGTGGGGGSWLCASDLFVCQHNCRVIAALKLQFAVTSRDSVRQYD